MTWMLVYDYPGEDRDCSLLDTIEDVRREIVGNAAPDEETADGLLSELLERGQWNDEGGCIKLFRQCGTASATEEPIAPQSKQGAA